ncbi:ubiquitin-protein ligase [Lactifluus volemus]|nr:ubiquitin-protein ligase [Lactifluus volemus]
MVLLVTSDNEQFVVDKDVAQHSALLKPFAENDSGSDQPVPLPNISSSVLKKVLEYCEHYRGVQPATTDPEAQNFTTNLNEWDKKFMAVDQEMLFEIILAANYLDIKPLIDVGCKTVANMIKGKTPEEIRKLFNIINNVTPEEETHTREANEQAEGH